MQVKTLVKTLLSLCFLTNQLAWSAQPLRENEFAIVDRYTLGGEGAWDLLTFDKKRHRLFISRSTHVQVIDTGTGELIGDISGTEGVHGIALADDLNVGFTSNGKSNSVTVFDLTTLKVIETIKISGANPDVILYAPKSKHILSFNGRSADATVIDAATFKEIGTINLPGKPELAVSNDAGEVFVNIEDKNEITVIDSGTNHVLRSFKMGSCDEPTGLAIDLLHHRLFSVCANRKMVILDSETGRLVSEVNIGAGPDSAAFDPGLGVALSSNGDGTLTVVKENDPDHFVVSQNLITRKGARTMAYDPDNHRAYLATAEFGKTPPATEALPKPKAAIIPNSFLILVVASKNDALTPSR